MTVGGNQINLDISSTLAAANNLEITPRGLLNVARRQVGHTALAYSTVSGLGEMGDTHSTILSSNSAESIQAFADRFSNAAITLRQNVSDVVNADDALAQSLDAYERTVAMGNSVGLRGLDSSALSAGSAGSVTNTDTQHLSFTPPVVSRPPTLMGLIGQFSGTNHGAPPSMSGDWTSLASQIQTAADSLESVLGDLESSSETEAIQRAMNNIRALQTTGYAFANNSRGLAINTSNLGIAGASQAQQASQVASLYLTALPVNPTLAKTIEQAFLTSFPPAMTTTLVPSVPNIAQLLPPMPDPNGASAGALGAIGATNPGAQLTTWDDVPLPTVVQEAMDHYGMGDAARMRNPQDLAEEFNRNGPDAIDAIMAGHAPTTTASAGAPALPPTLNPGAQLGASPAVPSGAAPSTTGNLGGIPGIGATPAGGPAGANGRGMSAGQIPTNPATTGIGNSGRLGGNTGGLNRTGVGGGRLSIGNVGSIGRAGRSTSAGSIRGAVGPNAAGSIRGVGGPNAAGGIGGPRGSGGFGAPIAGTGFRGGYGTGGNYINGAPAGTPPHGFGKTPGGSGTPGVFGASPGGATAAGKSSASTHGARGAMPMGGMMGAGRGAGQRGAKSNPVRKVTSAVERDGNLKALLGEGPEVIPGVIGAWVREPRSDR